MDIRSVGAGYTPKIYHLDKTDKSEKARNTPPPETAKDGQEKVELSNAASDVQTVLDAVRVLPEVRIDMVEEIKERIKNNDYPIANKLDDLIEKMLDNNVLTPR